MKHLFLCLFVLLTTISCQKKDDPAPAAPLPGTYTINRMIDSRQSLDLTLPTTISGQAVAGTIVVTQPSSERIAFDLKLTIAGIAFSELTAEATIRKGSGNTYTILSAANAPVGTIDGTMFNLDATENGRRLVITARK
jgi:hypothetical protein